MTRPIRVLHLEDSPRDAELIHHQLEVGGVRCDIVLAEGKDTFEEALARESFDLILTDFNLPDYDGISAIRRARERQPDTPVIVISGTIGEEDAIRCLHKGATDYVLKQRLTRLATSVTRAMNEAAERRRSQEAERELAQREQRISSIYDTAADVLFSLDVEGDGQYRFASVNKAFVARTGLRSDEVVGKRVDDIIPEPSLTLVLEKYREAIRGRRIVRWEETSAYSTGTLAGAVSIAPIFDEAGTCTQLVGAVHDLSARRRMEEELRRMNAELDARVASRTAELETAREAALSASRAKSVFLANMSHEIRTPLNAVLGFAQLLNQGQRLLPDQRSHVSAILRSGEHLLQLLTDILELSKIEAGRAVSETSACDLQAVVQGLDAVFRHAAERKSLRLLTEVSPESARYVVTDEGKLRQILQNLLSNAIKFTAHGGVAVRMAVAPAPGAGGTSRLVAEVEDSGSGMSPEELGRVFHAFEQAHAGRAARTGTGLGLAISRRFAELLGGTLEADSEPGHGSTFRLNIPVTLATIEDVPTPVQLPAEAVLSAGQAPCRVLVVDDVEDNRVFLGELLVRAGFEVRLAEDGVRAVEAFQAWGPHLILMDMRMPRLSGREAIIRIRAMEGGAGVKVLAVTASAFREERHEAIEAGADGVVSKPFRAGVLLARIQALLGLRYQDRGAVGRAPAPTSTADGAPLGDPLGAPVGAGTAARLPDDLMARLRAAALSADLDRILDLADEVRGYNLETAEAIRRDAERFAYAEVLAVLDRESGRV